MQLENRSRVVIAGGGPAGSFSAILLNDYAYMRELDLDITVLERKDFGRSGHGGCNSCAGVVSSSLVGKLSQIEIKIPEDIVQRDINGFTLETSNASLELTDESQHIVTVFRGNGPGRSNYKDSISFDGFLRDEAVRRGIQFVNATVTSITPAASLEEKVRITAKTSRTAEEATYEADLLIGALGMSGANIFEQGGFGYQKAQAVRLAQAEIAMDPDKIEELFGKHIYVYYLGIPGIRHAAITPKREYITVTVVSSGTASEETPRSLKEKINLFLGHKAIAQKLGNTLHLLPSCFCSPEMPYKDSVQPYGDRIVIVGDAAYARLYKNGVESAFTTSDMAVRTALEHGISKECFERHYHKPAAAMFNRDNRYGRMLFSMGYISSKFRSVIDEHFNIANADTENGERLRGMFWSMLAGDRPYRDIFLDMGYPPLLVQLGWAALKGAAYSCLGKR